MYQSIRRHVSGIDFGDKVLSISHSNHLCQLVGIPTENIIEANYPKQNICSLDLPSETFTAVVSDQVFEHMACEPHCAVDECYRVLVPGGLAMHTTCFLMPYHGSADYEDCNDGDYWRYTTSGLRLLHKKYSKVICSEGWGNPLMNLVGGLGLQWLPVPAALWHPINKLARYNRPSYACVVWIIAQK
jgi:hypothetical protein